MRGRAEAHLRRHFAPGVYVDAKTINEIVKHMYAFYATEFKKTVVGISSRQLLEFTLHQYQQTVEIENQLKAGELADAVRQEWEKSGPTRRRALKFIAEEIVMGAPEAPSADEASLLEMTECRWIAAEAMVDMAMQSDYAFILFPDEVKLTIASDGSDPYWTLTSPEHAEELIHRVGLDRANRVRFIPRPEFVFDPAQHNDFIGESVRSVWESTTSRRLRFSCSLSTTVSATERDLTFRS